MKLLTIVLAMTRLDAVHIAIVFAMVIDKLLVSRL